MIWWQSILMYIGGGCVIGTIIMVLYVVLELRHQKDMENRNKKAIAETKFEEDV